MSKSKWFAIIISTPVLGFAAVAYGQTYFDPPSLVVSKPAQPVSSIAISGARHVPFTRADLTARGTDIVIDEITVEKVGVSDDEAFEDILLLDDTGEELGSGSLDDDHVVRFNDPIYIPRDTTLHLTVAADMAEDLSGLEGQTAGFSITGIVSHGHVRIQ